MITMTDVEHAVCVKFQITHSNLIRTYTGREVTRPRQIAMYLCRTYTDSSYPAIGKHFRRDHTTVVHAFQRMTALIASDKVLACQIEGCKDILGRLIPWKEAARLNLTGARAA